MKKYLILALVACFAQQAAAQQTGSFNTTITFNGANRDLANFVPTDYNAAQEYKLVIGLHGSGDNAANYRNTLVNVSSFANAFPNTILICPDGGSDLFRDFYQPAGDELVIEEAISYAIANYNIDTHNIVLQGFSLGGRSALKYGLEHSDRFKALMLNTPAIQGVKEAANATAFTFDFTNAAALPIYVTLGADDVLYLEPVKRMLAQLAANNGKFAYKTFSTGHLVPNFNNYPYLAFFDQPFSPGADAGIHRLSLPERSCNGMVAASVLLQNTGNAALDSVKLVYGIGNNVDTMVWQQGLAQHQSVAIDLPVFAAGNVSTDNYDFKVEVLSLDQNISDDFADFNTMTANVHIMPGSLNLPFEEQFSNSSSLERWAFKNSGDYLLPFEFYDEDEALFSFNSIFIFDNAGTAEEVISPKLDLSAQTAAYLHFNVDYNYVRYTAAVSGIDSIFADTLEVLVSKDCGENYTSVLKRTAADLSGHDEPLMNPMNLAQVALDKDETKYRTFTVDMNQFTGQEDVAIKFRYISGLGGYIYLDDVVVNSSPVSVQDLKTGQLAMQVYPNPTKGLLNIEMKELVRINDIKVYNLLGQVIFEAKGTGGAQQAIGLDHLAEGSYLIKVTTDRGIANAKFLKN